MSGIKECQTFIVHIERHSSFMPFYESHERRLSITPARRETLAFLRKSRDSSLRRASECMGGDISAVVASASRRPRASKCLVKVGSRAFVERLQHFNRPPVCHDSSPGHQVSYRRFWENRRTPDSLPTKAHALITNLLSLISPSVHLIKSGTRPLVKASLSRRRQSITRCRSN